MQIDIEKTNLSEKEMRKMDKELKKAHENIENKNGAGSDFLGWTKIEISSEEILRIKQVATQIRKSSDILIVIGIGGSYLGARAVIDALSNTFEEKNVIFAGNNMSPDYLNDLIDHIKNKDYSINVISKSGTTTEPAIAFKILKEQLVKKYGEEEARKRIIVTTDKQKGLLRKEAINKGYETFDVPEDIGGRYSVLTPVGLLPIAVAGIDIERLLEGAKNESKEYQNLNENNECYNYAVARNILYKKGKKIELFASYEPKMHYFLEWLKQLYGESEGKNKKGIFPVSADFTTDLHSLGQYIQEGERHIFETIIDIEKPYRDLSLGWDEDGDLSYLNGKTLNEINHMAMQGTITAHVAGDVPNIKITISKIDEENVGKLIYFFEKACGISGYILGVNPFNQPGVEAYKNEMYKLLGKK